MTTSSKVILGLVLGGMMSLDFGGPINKAAYVFGTASLLDAAGNPVSSGIMAAVMVGGMVPPIGLSLAMLLFRHKFTPTERNALITNFIMGLSFITEGAIPFAASDPLHVIPSCAIGAPSPAACPCSLAAPFRLPTEASSCSASSRTGPCTWLPFWQVLSSPPHSWASCGKNVPRTDAGTGRRVSRNPAQDNCCFAPNGVHYT